MERLPASRLITEHASANVIANILDKDNIADSAHFPACRLKSIEQWRHLAAGRTDASGRGQ